MVEKDLSIGYNTVKVCGKFNNIKDFYYLFIMLTEILLGGVAGLLYGAVIGYLKYALLWKKTIKKEESIAMSAVTKRMVANYAVNLLALLFVFLLRNVMPFDFMWPLLGTAVALSVATRLAPMHEVMKYVEPSNKAEERIE